MPPQWRWRRHQPAWPDRGATATHDALGMANGRMPMIHVITTPGPPLLFPLPLTWQILRWRTYCCVALALRAQQVSQIVTQALSLSICQPVSEQGRSYSAPASLPRSQPLSSSVLYRHPFSEPESQSLSRSVSQSLCEPLKPWGLY